MWFLLIAALIGFFIYFVVKRIESFNNEWQYLKHLPGPPGNFLLGQLTDMTESTEKTFENRNKWCLTYPSLLRIRLIDKLYVIIYNPEDIETLMSSTKHLSKSELYDNLHQWLGTGLLTSTGSKWHRRRKLLTSAFHFSILQEFVPIFNKEAEKLVVELKKMCNEPYIDVIKPTGDFTLSSIVETSLGIKMDDYPNASTYRDAVYKYAELFSYELFRPWLRYPFIRRFSSMYKPYNAVVNTLHNFTWNLIQERKQEFQKNLKSTCSSTKRVGLLDSLLKAKYLEGAEIDDKGIREEVDTFTFEGHDTTAVALCYILMALANEQIFQDKIYQEIVDILGDKSKPEFQDFAKMTLMERCIKECLRLYPSVPIIARNLQENMVTKDGFILPKGVNVSVEIYSLHHTPSVWENPEKFDPDRFLPENVAKMHPYAYIPFSAGPRNCIGQKFAMIELKAALCGIFRTFKLLPVTKPEDIKFKADIVLRSSCEINVKFVPRSK